MDIFQQTKELCKLYDITPARSKGQNFLINENTYNEIIKAAELNKDDVALEVGPGLGFLTAALAKRVKKVIAVELDDKLVEVLRTGLAAQGIKNVEVVNGNILDFGIKISDLNNYKIVANLPYNITSIFLRKFLTAEHKPSMMVLMLQKEVAERIVAEPGKMSLLAISVQYYARPEIIKIVPKNNFWPTPEVDSAIIKLTINNLQLTINEKDFFRLVKIGFSARRKMLKNNLANGLHVDCEEVEKILTASGSNPKIRAQDLSVSDWKKIFGKFCQNMV